MLRIDAWFRPLAPIPRWGVWLGPALIVGSGLIVLAEADVLAYGIWCGVILPAILLADWVRLRSLDSSVRVAVDRLFWTTAFVFGWFAMLLLREGR